MTDKNPAPTAEPENRDAVATESEEVATEDVATEDVATEDVATEDVATEEAVAPPRRKTAKTPVSPAVEAVPAKSADVPEAASTASASQPRVVYVEAPLPPRMKGNRGIGALFSLLAVPLYAVLLAVTAFVASFLINGRGGFEPSGLFYIPIIAFAIGFLLLALILNRAGWAAYVVGSILVAVIVYFGTIGGVLLANNVFGMTAPAASLVFRELLGSPIIILAALLAREVSLWVGAAISARGKSVKAKNAEARANFEKQAAERKAEFEAAKAESAS